MSKESITKFPQYIYYTPLRNIMSYLIFQFIVQDILLYYVLESVASLAVKSVTNFTL